MRVLVLAPPVNILGRIQRYMATLVAPLQELLTEQDVCVLAVRKQPKPRSDCQEKSKPGLRWQQRYACLLTPSAFEQNLLCVRNNNPVVRELTL